MQTYITCENWWITSMLYIALHPLHEKVYPCIIALYWTKIELRGPGHGKPEQKYVHVFLLGTAGFLSTRFPLHKELILGD